MIASETQFVLKLIWNIILTPWVLYQAAMGRRPFSDVLQPITDLWDFIWEARVTALLITINVVAFIASRYFFDPTPFMSYPSDLQNPQLWYRFVSAGFLHASWVHLGLNMLALLIFGRAVERTLGTFRMVIVYAVALVFSMAVNAGAMLYLGTNTPGIGASGAIAGLIAAATLLDPFYFVYEFIVPLPIMVVGWAYLATDILGLLGQGASDVGYFAHIGGYISVSIAFIMLREYRDRLFKGLLINGASLAIAGAVYFLAVK